jgi:hypothetical protein
LLPNCFSQQEQSLTETTSSLPFVAPETGQLVCYFNDIPWAYWNNHGSVALTLKQSAFGGESVITENMRDEQRKFIKYNHLVANLLSFHTLVTVTKALQQLLEEGYTVDMQALSTLSPYRTKHINPFGNYVINLNRMPEPLDQHLGLSLSPVSA